MVAVVQEMYFSPEDVEGQDDFLKRLISGGLNIPRSDFVSSHDIHYGHLKELIDGELQTQHRGMHRVLLQIAQLRDHQYFLSLHEERHVSTEETVASWKESFAEDFARKYYEEYAAMRD